MSVPAMWIRNNMLFCGQHERQLTEAELKVQRSLHRLSIPEWYLNKRSNPPKILTNTPFDCRPPSWKHPDWKKTSVMNLNALTITDTPSYKSQEKPGPNSTSTGTYKDHRDQKSPNSKQQKPPSTTTEKMDTSIPHVTPRRDISKTFPKMSPSRKLNNINIVLNRKPSPLELSRQDDNLIPSVSNYGTYVLTKRAKTAKKNNNDSSKSAEDSKISPQKTSSPNKRERKKEQPEDNINPPELIYAQITPQKTSSPNKKNTERKEQPEDSIQPPEPIYAQITPKTKSKFKVRTASTPKFSPGSLLSSTIIEESPKGRRQPSENILRKLSIFEDSWKDTSMCDDSTKASRSMEYRSSTLKSECDKLSVSYEETSNKRNQKLRNLLDKNIQSIDPILFEPMDSPNSSTSVREIVKKVESINIIEKTPVKRSHLEWKKSMVPAVSKDLEESPKTPVRLEKDTKSPCVRSYNFRRMSIVPQDWKNIEEPSKAPVQLRKDRVMEKKNVESPNTRISKSRRMSIVPEDCRNIEEFSKAPTQLRKDNEMEKKDVESPNTRISKSRRLSIVPEDWRNIEEFSKAPAQLRKDNEMEMKNVESPNTRISKSRRMSIVPEDWRNIEEFSKAPAQLRKDNEMEMKNVESPNTRISKSRRMSIVPEDWRNIEEFSKAPAQLRKDNEMEKKDVESPNTRISKSRRMSIVPEDWRNIEEFSMAPAQLTKDNEVEMKNVEYPNTRISKSRRMSIVPEDWRNIEEFSKAPALLRKDNEMEMKNVESPNTRISKSRRMSIVPEDWRNIEEFSKAPALLRKDNEMEMKNVESPNTRISKSRRMSIVPEDWRNIEEFSKAPALLRKDNEMEMKNVESPNTRISKSRRMSIVPEELKELQEASRMLAQQRKEMEKSFSCADSPATKFFNSRRTSWGSCEIKNIGESSKKDSDQDPDQPNSPSTRFLNSRRKSMELENLVRSKQPSKQTSVVRDIITAMTARAIKQAQLRKQDDVPGVQQNFVKTVVDAMEKGQSSFLDDTNQESFTSTIRNVDDLGSASESDAKSSTPVYSNDTESSDSEGRSPILVESDDSGKTVNFDMSLDTNKATEQKHRQEDDSVYWIPVARCKLPRTSSLLSMMSRLSTNCDSSPCVSPIRSDSDNENAQIPWGATFKKNPALSKNLFRIDETIVIDSGYSDRSDKSPAGCTTTDSNWSEDTQYESATEVSSKNRITRASRRKCGTGTTFRVSKF